MNQKFLKSFGVPVLILLMIIGTSGFAAITGKIAGRVVDAETNEALPGANVMIEGSNWGAASDMEGYYFIINLPPGQYSLRTSMMGYETITKTEVPVIIDRTTTINFNLKSAVLEAGVEVTVVAERAIVPLDVANTQAIINPDRITQTVYHDISDVVASQVGIEGGTLPSIRGSGARESAFMIDGIMMVDEISHTPYFKVNLSSVQEVQVITGGFNAEYGNVRSGLINVVTKEGSNRYSGSIELKYSPPGLKHFGPMAYSKESPLMWPFMDRGRGAWEGGNDYFDGWVKTANENIKEGEPHYGKPEELYALWLWRHRSPDAIKELKNMGYNVDEDEAWFNYGHDPDWTGEVSFGGPIPFFEKLKFYFSHKVENTAYAMLSAEKYYKDANSTIKFTYNINPSMKLNAHFLYGYAKGSTRGATGAVRTNRTGTYISSDPYETTTGAFNKIFYIHCDRPGAQWRYVGGMNFTHTLSPSTFYEVRFSQNYVDFGKINEWRYTTPGDDPVYWQAHRLYGRLGTDEEVKTNNWSKYAKIKIGDYWYDEAPKGYSRVNWRDITGFFRMESCAMEFDRSITRTYDLRGSLTSQVNRFNQIKVGIELGKDRIHQSFERVRLMSTETEIIKQHPWRGAVFAQDKLEFQGMIANVGLRVDFINRDEAIVLDGPNEDKVNGPYSKYLGVGMADSMSFLPMKSVGDLRWSPRLGISHPISENAKIFFNYGHFYKWPETLESYRIERTGSKGNMVTILGNPQLDPPRTVQYEVGYAHNLFDLIELGLTGYYKDVSDEISNIRMYFMDKNYYDFFVNNQYRDIRGIEIRADMRRGRFVSGWANYNYMVTSTGKYGFDRLYEDPRTTPRDVSSDITQPESRPILRVNLDFHTPPEFGPQLGGLFPLADINLNLLYTRREGEKFTWNPKGIPYVEDNMRWRAWQMVDLRFTKRLFKFKGIEPVFYIDVFNLFDTKNMIMPDIDYVSSTDTRIDEASSNWVWDPGGYWKNEFVEYMNSLDLDGGDKPGDWKGDHIKLPHSTFWTFLNKRDIFFGIRINFD